MLRSALALLLLLTAPAANAAETVVAVAANFTAPMKEIGRAFEEASGHHAIQSYGSTGTLYAQVLNGAPFDVFLAADRRRPRSLFEDGLAEKPFTYAIGTLVLWSADPALVDAEGKVLGSGRFERLALANPKTAPYGEASIQVLKAMGLLARLEPRLVRGDNIAQTYQFVATGNAPLGFVALSQVAALDRGSHWLPPRRDYEPIRQDAVLLLRGRDNPAAAAFVAFLAGERARAIVARYGYGVPEDRSDTRPREGPADAPPK